MPGPMEAMRGPAQHQQVNVKDFKKTTKKLINGYLSTSKLALKDNLQI